MIYKKRGKYVVQVYDPALKRKRHIGTFVTKGEARKAERRAEEEASKPRLSDDTCERFAERWLEEHCKGLEASTLKTYSYAVRKFAEDFRGVRLESVDRPMARRWALGQPRNSQNVIRTLFMDAHRDGLITANPFANLGLKQSRGRKDIRAIKPDELEALADAALAVHGDYGPTFRAMILFAAYTGMRPGEIFALKWEDLSDTEVHVHRSLSTVGTLKPPKNGQARVIPLLPQARDALKNVDRIAGQPWVFTSKTGRRFTRPTLANTWHPVRAAAGKHGMDFYELRHFCATYLIELGLRASDVAVQLGQTDNGKLVMECYGHPDKDVARMRILRTVQDDLEQAA